MKTFKTFYWKHLDIWWCFAKISFYVFLILFIPMMIITWGKCIPQSLAVSITGGLTFAFIFRLYILIDKYANINCQA